MNNDLMVSIIVPCHNSEKYISRTIESLINQNFALKYKIITVNDNSNDSTLTILNEYKKKYPLLIEVISCNFSNLSKARNIAFDSALKAKYICFCDSDDIPSNDFVSSLFSLVENTGSDVGVLDYRVVKEGKIIKKRNGYLSNRTFTPEKACKELIKDTKCKAYVWNKIFKSSMLLRTGIRFIPEKFVYEDLVFSFQCFSQANYISFGIKSIYDYMIYSSSLSHSRNPEGYLMHINAYAACKMYSIFSLGKEKSSYIFNNMRIHMFYKVLCDIIPCKKIIKGRFFKEIKLAYKLIKNITSNNFKIVSMPWENYIIDLGFMKYNLLQE